MTTGQDSPMSYRRLGRMPGRRLTRIQCSPIIDTQQESRRFRGIRCREVPVRSKSNQVRLCAWEKPILLMWVAAWWIGLDRPRRRIVSVGHVVWRVAKGFACVVGEFLVFPVDSTNRVHCPVVPGNPCLAIHIRPATMFAMKRAPSASIVIQSDVK